MSRTLRGVYKNLGASILPQILNIATNLVLPTMIIGTFGSQTNGLISTIKSIVSYVSLVGAGLSVATTQALYLPVAQNNEGMVRGLLKATQNMFNRCGYIYLAIVIIIAFLYPITINSSLTYGEIAALVIVISIAGASEFFAVGTCRSLLYADRKTYIATSIQAASLLVSLISAVILLHIGAGIVWVQLAMSLVYIIRAIFLKRYVWKAYPQYRICGDTVAIKSAVKKRSDAMIHQLSGLAVTSTQTIILSAFVGLEAASIYSVYNIVFAGVFSICSNINNALTPYMGRALATRRGDDCIRTFNIVEYGFFLLTSFIMFVAVATIVPFIGIYTKGADINYVNGDFALMFVVVQVFNLSRLPANALINAAGHFRETRSRAIIEACICVIISIITTYFFGIYGVLIGTGCAFGWRCIDIIIYSNKNILKREAKTSIRRLIRCFILCAISLFVFCTRQQPQLNGYLDWIGYASIVALVAVIVLAFDSMLFDRQTIVSLFRTVCKKQV